MPLVRSTYRSPLHLFNGHLETIVPSMLRKIGQLTYSRERLELADGDFVDLDWVKTGSSKAVVISHGLEGSSERHYSKGMARMFSQHGWDAIAWNCRSCSGEMNRLPRFYHHGDTADIKSVVDHALSLGYQQVALVGLSMGGSMSLKYLGEFASSLPSSILGAAVFSVPCDLASSAAELDRPSKSFYRNRFLRKLERKIRLKEQMFPGQVSAEHFDHIKTFEDFDNAYTAPLHGFEDAKDFYKRASCGLWLEAIGRPALIVNAANDPFLPVACFPKAVAERHPTLHLEIPETGGHVGFSVFRSEHNWMEMRALEFFNSVS